LGDGVTILDIDPALTAAERAGQILIADKN
jgi:hypothetical protein